MRDFFRRWKWTVRVGLLVFVAVVLVLAWLFHPPISAWVKQSEVLLIVLGWGGSIAGMFVAWFRHRELTEQNRLLMEEVRANGKNSTEAQAKTAKALENMTKEQRSSSDAEKSNKQE